VFGEVDAAKMRDDVHVLRRRPPVASGKDATPSPRLRRFFAMPRQCALRRWPRNSFHHAQPMAITSPLRRV